MNRLENRIPPPLVAILIALLMGVAARLLPSVAIAPGYRVVSAIAVLLLGLSVCLAGVWAFRRAQTTVNPLRPDRASALVDTGIYRYTRNPMYLGFSLVLVAWALALASPLTLLGIVAFVWYMNRLQIGPEERALSRLFGEPFSRYCQRVRRWI